MTRYCQDPKLDENAKVGLSFIAIGYGVVLVAVFPTLQPSHLGLAGWFHLGLAASVLVISYMGYYSNRQEYAAWRVRFFNIPLTQYLISFGILFLYWELGITLPKNGSQATPVSEAVIMVIIFGAYLVWDCLEVTVQESGRYIYALYRARQTDMLPPLIRRYRQGLWRQRPISTKSRWRRRRIHRFAKDVRAGRAVTFLFLLLYGLGLAVVVIYHLQGTVSVAVVDGVYILGLFLYRYSQWVWARCWYHRI
jgi:hypothetical protein